MSRKTNPRALVKPVISIAVFAVVLFLSAGTIQWPAAWIYLIALVINTVVISLLMDPELLEERNQIGHGVKRWDIPLALIMGRLGPLVTLLIAGLDRRFGGSPLVHIGWVIAAFVFLLAGLAISDWAVLANRFFSGVVRIQTERGHQVVQTGPYRWVRHPGYLGSILYILATPVILGSLWAFIPAGLTAAAAVMRTELEDHTLQNELSGYSEYARRVSARLIPGLW